LQSPTTWLAAIHDAEFGHEDRRHYDQSPGERGTVSTIQASLASNPVREDAMAKTMRAAIVRKFKEPLSIEEVAVPEI
jgi:hypothetical protein